MTTAILLSGGMDSTALCFWRRPQIAFTIDYGQAAVEGEIRASRHVAESLGIRWELIRADCSSLGSGDLAGQPACAVAPVPEWWPFRNQLLVTLAGMRCVSLGITELLVASVRTDGSHRDGTTLFYQQLDALMSEQEGGIRVRAPAIDFTTAELVRRSSIPMELLAWSHSCHVAPFACGQCRGCAKHSEVMAELGYGLD